MNDPSATSQMKREGSSAFTALKNAFGAQNDSGLARKVTDRALRIIAGNYVTGQLVTEGDPFFQLASEFLRGTVGSTDTASGTGGVKQAYYHIQRMATFMLKAPTSRIVLTRKSLNFGTIQVGSSKSDSLFLRNTGANLLTVDSVRVTNQYFSILPTSASIAVNDSAKFKVTYSPLAQGTHSGLIILISNSPSARDTVAIQGTASPFSSVVLGLFDQTPARFALHQNYPNPFNPSTEITFEVPVRSRVWIAVYSILGQEISRLVDGQDVKPGTYSAHWQSTATSGIYICRLQALDLGTQQLVSFSRRMVLLR
jgi:hypothetical protein